MRREGRLMLKPSHVIMLLNRFHIFLAYYPRPYSVTGESSGSCFRISSCVSCALFGAARSFARRGRHVGRSMDSDKRMHKKHRATRVCNEPIVFECCTPKPSPKADQFQTMGEPRTCSQTLDRARKLRGHAGAGGGGGGEETIW